jgi:FkbM family methyltransferase
MIIDGGAHLGSFAMMVFEIFPRAAVHMIDPQPACQKTLSALARERGFHLHAYALGSTAGQVSMWTDRGPTTGASIAAPGQAGNAYVQVERLDTLFLSSIEPGDRTLLKLDLQGFELAALEGAPAVLRVVEVILTEVSFFAQSYEPSPAALIAFLDAAGFELYDIASLSGRRRDDRLKQGDLLFVRRDSPFVADRNWD